MRTPDSLPKQWPFWLVFAALLIIPGCGPSGDQLIGAAYDAFLGETPPAPTGTGYAFHRFIPTGQRIDIGGMGEILELIEITEAGPRLTADGTGLLAETGGISCVRYRYRSDSPGESTVQTQCFIAADRMSQQAGTPLELDLETFLGDQATGNANYLSQGDGRFYGITTSQEEVTLSPTPRQLPPLMLRLVDAFAEESSNAIGSEDIDLLRSTRLITYTGRTLAPPLLALVGSAYSNFALSPDGTVTLDPVSCSEQTIEGVECSDDPDLIQTGDVLVISPRTPSTEDFRQMIETDSSLVDAFVSSHQISRWSSIDSIQATTDVRENVIARLAAIQLNAFYFRYFDNLYSARAKSVPVAARLPFTVSLGGLSCAPEDRDICQGVEDEVALAEKRVVDGLKEEGFEVWISYFLRYDDTGQYLPLTDQAPHISLFDGIVLDVNTNASPPGTPEFIAEALPNAIAGAALEIGSMPVMVSPWAGPMDFYTEGRFCEGEICASDFEDYYRINEGLFHQALESFPLGQIKAFVVPLVDGGHFDIRDPLEGGINRTGETGFNNPLLNLYLTQ